MLAKLTSKNQLTLPKSVVEAVAAAEYFDVEVRGGQIVLTPVRIQRGDAVRAKLTALGLTDADVADAVRWARSEPAAPRVAEPPPAKYASAKRPARSAPKKKASSRG
jgi:hypothetical protein